VGMFNEWRKEVGVEREHIKDFKFDTLYGQIETNEITFGYYKGRNKWEKLRYLFESAPTDWDRSALTRVMIEEMRHGWQMCALLIGFFGETGKVEAKKMLERRAYENKRLLGSFNEECDNWLDFFAFTDFVD